MAIGITTHLMICLLAKLVHVSLFFDQRYITAPTGKNTKQEMGIKWSLFGVKW
jgi:hypothetical protein